MRLFPIFVLSFALLAPFGASADPVDINSADARLLAKELKGIGPARAEAIVAYRAQNGPFKSADELALVKGISQKVIDQNRGSIRTDRSGASAQKPSKPAGAQAGERPRPKPSVPH